MRDFDLLPKAFKYGCVSTVVRPMGVRINCMVADALRYTQEASFPKLIAKSMRVRAPLWIQKWSHRPTEEDTWLRTKRLGFESL